LVINPSQEPDQDPSAVAKIVRFVSSPDKSFAIADLTTAYVRHAEKVLRGVMLDRKRRFVLVQDELALKQPGEIWWFMHTPAEVELSDDGRVATLTQGDAQLRAVLLSPENARFSVMDARPLPTSPDPAGQNPNKGVRKLAVNLREVKSATVSIALLPLRKGEEPRELPSPSPLDSWGK
jgi:hypothetical protein